MNLKKSSDKEIYMLLYIFATFITFWEEREQQQSLFQATAKDLHGSVNVAWITCFVFWFGLFFGQEDLKIV